MPFEIIRNDIAKVKADAIVNTANPEPRIGAGTDHAIHRDAGPQLLEARKQIGNIAPGEAAITPAFNLNAKYVKRPLLLFSHMGRLYQQPEQERASEDCRTR